MSDTNNKTIAQVHAEARAKFNALSPNEKIARLKEIGILNAIGGLAERYGGEPARAKTSTSRNARSRGVRG